MKMCCIILIIPVRTLILNDQFIVHWWIALTTLLTSFTSRAFSNWTFPVISNSFPKSWLSNLNFHIITCIDILVAMQCKKHLSTSPYNHCFYPDFLHCITHRSRIIIIITSHYVTLGKPPIIAIICKNEKDILLKEKSLNILPV